MEPMLRAAISGFTRRTGAIFSSVEIPIAPVEKFKIKGQRSWISRAMAA